jgi:hypothetical protein
MRGDSLTFCGSAWTALAEIALHAAENTPTRSLCDRRVDANTR